jgi:hypothetical protein
MKEETILTEGPIPSETTPVAKSIVINIAPEGGIKVDFNGELATHEVFGALAVTFMDLGVQNFINPGLASVLKGVAASEGNLMEAMKKSVGPAPQTSDLLTGLQNLITEVQAK